MAQATMKRFWSHIEKQDDGCWQWTGAPSGKSRGHEGYGQIMVCGKNLKAHRFSYEIHRGPVPPWKNGGLQLDHLCRNRMCVNPEHMRLVTQRENILWGEGVGAKHARKTHCLRGHEFTAENTYVAPAQPGRRYCMACHRIKSNEYCARKRIAPRRE